MIHQKRADSRDANANGTFIRCAGETQCWLCGLWRFTHPISCPVKRCHRKGDPARCVTCKHIAQRRAPPCKESSRETAVVYIRLVLAGQPRLEAIHKIANIPCHERDPFFKMTSPRQKRVSYIAQNGIRGRVCPIAQRHRQSAKAPFGPGR